MSLLFKIGLFVGAALCVAAGAWFGRVVPISEQWPMFEALRTTAAIIFAVIGAWMAIIYPERLKVSFRGQPEVAQPAESSTGWSKLFSPVVHSTLILAAILVLGAIVPILRHNPPNINVMCLRGASYGLLVAMTLWQLWTVVLTLIPADTVKSSLDEQSRHKTLIETFKSHGDRRG